MIRNLNAFMAGLWDWDILKGCFGETNIRPTDIDGCVERNGQTLVIEAKGPGKEIPRGQYIMYETWAKTGIFTIMIVWGDKEKPQELLIFRPDGRLVKKATDLMGFRQEVAYWYSWANNRKRGPYAAE